MIKAHLPILVFVLFFYGTIQAQEGRLRKTDLFTISSDKFPSASGFSFKIAADSKDNIAFNACSLPRIFLYSSSGNLVDSIELPTPKCIRAMEFDEQDNLLIMDNDEKIIYRYVVKYRKLESHPYTKPEDWYVLLNHYYRNFDLSSIPTYYSNNDFLQDFYSTRFNYSYNLFLNYHNGFIYQCHYNVLKEIDNHKSYYNLKKDNYWLSDHLTPKSKVLLVNDELRWAVYYDRFYNLIYENFNTGKVVVNAALEANSEPARFDYSSNIKQDKIIGVSRFSRKEITLSAWSF